MSSEQEHAFGSWLDQYKRNIPRTKDTPDHFLKDPECLLTDAVVQQVVCGTGQDIWAHLAPAITAANMEVVIITCFWAKSASSEIISDALLKLSDKALQMGTHRIRVFIGISSLSPLQKLTQTSSLHGWDLSPSQWSRKLGLPSERDLPGLTMHVKSIFVRPFSVMHPKFVMIDRLSVLLPSCNVSHEDWLEVAASMMGPIVRSFFTFWHTFWLQQQEDEVYSLGYDPTGPKIPPLRSENPHLIISNAPNPTSSLMPKPSPAVFLPSPHHANPQFRFGRITCFPSYSSPSTPYTTSTDDLTLSHSRNTPLNVFLLEHLATASTSIFLQSPNLTTPSLHDSVINALRRNVSVHIRTSDDLMILEQLVTAGTTTGCCISRLVHADREMRQTHRRHRHLQEASAATAGASSSSLPLRNNNNNNDDDDYTDNQQVDIEAAAADAQDERRPMLPLGRLRIEIFQNPAATTRPLEPCKTHAKASIFDGETVVLGSGNLDRASWWTSQELGVAVKSHQVAGLVWEALDWRSQGMWTTKYDSSQE